MLNKAERIRTTRNSVRMTTLLTGWGEGPNITAEPRALS